MSEQFRSLQSHGQEWRALFVTWTWSKVWRHHAWCCMKMDFSQILLKITQTLQCVDCSRHYMMYTYSSSINKRKHALICREDTRTGITHTHSLFSLDHLTSASCLGALFMCNAGKGRCLSWGYVVLSWPEISDCTVCMHMCTTSVYACNHVPM